MSEELPTIIARDGTYSLGGADVMYSYYPFVSADGMHQLNHEDLQYLERLGCYRLPSRHLLDEFVNAYFCHVHSHMPLLDEGDFRLAYNSKSSSSPRTTTSIFLLQAMLFAACCVCYMCPRDKFESLLLTTTVCPALDNQTTWLWQLSRRSCYVLPPS